MINHIEIASEVPWKKKLAAQFQTLRKRSNHFEEASMVLQEILVLDWRVHDYREEIQENMYNFHYDLLPSSLTKLGRQQI